MSAQACQAYRLLLRTIHTTFKGDQRAVQKLTREANQAFQANRHITDPTELQNKLHDAQEAADFVRECIIQAKRSPVTGEYEMPIEKVQQLEELAPELVHRKQ